MKLYFATLYNINYLNKGVVMYNSLMEHCADFEMFVFCLDDAVFDYWCRSPNNNVTPIRLSDLENFYPELNIAKQNRSVVEYFFTLSPFMPLYILENYSNVDVITSLDADICFFSDPQVLFNDMDKYSIMITPHRFSSKLKDLDIHGLYNVSFQSFKRDQVGMACLNEWKNNCFTWCYDRHEGDQYADQKYLDSWTESYPGVKVIDHLGAGLAPWNIQDVKFSEKNGYMMANNQPVIYYHYHAFRFLRPNIVSCGTGKYQVKPARKIYKPYIDKLMSLGEHEKAIDKQTNREKLKTGWNDIRFYKDLYFIVFGLCFRPLIKMNF